MTPAEQAAYDLDILIRMLNQLPDEVRPYLILQLHKAINAINAAIIDHQTKLCDKFNAYKDDINLIFTLQQFDLDATKRERDAAL
jgi:hypothetical protein